MHWKQMVNFLQKGFSFAPLHYLNQPSFEDLLMFDYSVASFGFAMAGVTTSCRKDHPSNAGKSKKKLAVSWDGSIPEDIVSKHNTLPSKGNFYKSKKPRTGVKYKPFPRIF